MPCCCCAKPCCGCGDSADQNANDDDDLETEASVIFIETDSHPHPGSDSDHPPADAPINISMPRPQRQNSFAQWNIAIFADDDPQFTELLKQAEAAIEEEILPERISQGSSGSYFVKNTDNENIGVFKPKDEEPYGVHNPKWAKWFQRHCCPCCFGRACLVPNTGYLSEAGASMVDEKLGLCVVPKTKVIRMASTTFHYGKIKRGTAHAKYTLANRFPAVGRKFHRVGLPLKIGSFQVFVKGYKDAIQWLQSFESDPLPPDLALEFQLEFERLVMLDYIIRNTDRGNENWLIRYEKNMAPMVKSQASDIEIALSPFSLGSVDSSQRKRIKIAAIDNGLAFPFKHPDEIRAYPFQWAKLSYAKVPFSRQSRDQFLPLLSNINVIEELCSELYGLFSLDRNFKKSTFDKQMSVMRGQVLNLANALREGKSPLQLSQMPNVRILRAIDMPLEPPNRVSISLNKSFTTKEKPGLRQMKISPTNTLMFDEEYKPEFATDTPLFTSW